MWPVLPVIPDCLESGAKTVDCVEQNKFAVEHAIRLFKDEADGQMFKGLHDIGASLIEYELSGQHHAESDRREKPRCTLSVEATQQPIYRALQLFQDFSSDAPLPGKYNLVVHEILGHIASSEGVVKAIRDLHNRSLLTRDCIFVPRGAATLFVPTMKLQLSCIERTLCLHRNRWGGDLNCLVKYHADRFPFHAFLAKPKYFEDLDFGGDLQMERRDVIEFITDISGVFDGLHFHMEVDMDGHGMIDTLHDDTSWSTTYVRLLDPGIFLPVGSRITCETHIDLDRADPFYSISVLVDRQQVAKFSWSGCTG